MYAQNARLAAQRIVDIIACIRLRIHTQAYAVKAVAPYTRMFRTIELKLRVLCSYVRVDMYLRTIPYSFFFRPPFQGQEG